MRMNDRLAGIRVCTVLPDEDLFMSRFPGLLELPSIHAVASAREALALLSRHAWDVLITWMDLDCTAHSGLRLLSRALASQKDMKGIVLCEAADRHDVVAAFRAGARGLLLASQCNVFELRKAIGRVHEGQVWASSRHLCFVLDEFATHKGAAERADQLNSALSPRELEVAQFIVKGKSNKEIAAALRLSPHTVKNHIVKIFTKLGVSNRSAAVFRFYQQSLLRPMPHTLTDSAEIEEAINL